MKHYSILCSILCCLFSCRSLHQVEKRSENFNRDNHNKNTSRNLNYSSNSALSSNKEIEDFVNKVYVDFIPDYFKYYYLEDISFPIDDDFVFTLKNQKKFLKANPDFNITEWNKKTSEAKENQINWSTYNLVKARICNQDSIKLQPFMLSPKYKFIWNSFLKPKLSESLLDSIVKTKKKDEFIVPVKWYWGNKKRMKAGQKIFDTYKKIID